MLTLSRRTKLYLRDEPLGGIDPLAKRQVIDTILQHFLPEESTMIISTHLLKDTERVFDYVLFLKDGVIALHGDIDELRETQGKTLEALYVSLYA